MLSWLRTIQEFLRGRSVGYLEEEEKELTTLFALLIFSPLVGIPLYPPILALELLPYSLEEIERLEGSERRLDDLFGHLAGMLAS